jgi:hypothetical protein
MIQQFSVRSTTQSTSLMCIACPPPVLVGAMRICSTDWERDCRLGISGMFCNTRYFSDLPRGLTAGVDAFAWAHHTSWVYSDQMTGSTSELRAAISDVTSWTWSDSIPQPIPNGFIVMAEPPPPQSPPLPTRRRCQLIPHHQHCRRFSPARSWKGSHSWS